jgi:hypothetical protein
MDGFITKIVDLLRGDENAEMDPLSAAAYKTRTPMGSDNGALKAGGEMLSTPAYSLYKREALANGEPVMSPEEFALAQGK